MAITAQTAAAAAAAGRQAKYNAAAVRGDDSGLLVSVRLAAVRYTQCTLRSPGLSWPLDVARSHLGLGLGL